MFEKRKARKLLNDAADLIEEEGWIQGEEHNSGGYCAIGALKRISGSEWPHITKAHIVAVGALSSRVASPIVDWNDAPGRTKEEVVNTLREAL